MTLLRAALSSALIRIALIWGALGATAGAQDLKPDAKPDPIVIVPAGAAPIVDGRLDDAAWKKAATFRLLRDKEMQGEGWVLRDGRQLHIAYRSMFKPISLGVRMHFVDPRTRRRVAVLVAPLELPKAPLSLWLEKPGAPPARLDASLADVRFDFSSKQGFTFEMRLPLDLIEIGRPRKTYGFNVEVWDTEARRVLSVFPSASSGTTIQQGTAKFEPAEDGAGDWGSDVSADGAAPPANAALAILQRIGAEGAASPDAGGRPAQPVMVGYFGMRDGRRLDAPLAKLEDSLRGLIERYPDYASLRANLVRVLVGRNDPARAIEVMASLREINPSLARNERQALVEMQLLRDSGQYAKAIELLDSKREMLKHLPFYGRERTMLGSLQVAWERELAYRAADAQRDDLPRVRIETNRGAFVVELFEDDAPNAVANFVSLAQSGFYDGTRFHWSTAGGSTFGGDPNSRDNKPFNDGFGDPGYLIESEPSKRLHFPDTISMVSKRRREFTEGSIFALNMTAATERDGRDSVIGRIVEGVAIARHIGYGDTIKSTKVLRKRDHEYKVAKRPKS